MPPAFSPLVLAHRPREPVSFLLVCACGEKLRGVRQPRAQVIACAACGMRRFVLGLSPMPDPVGPAVPVRRSRASVAIGFAGAGAFVLMILLGVILVAMLAPGARSTPTRAEVPASVERLDAQTAAGRAALAEGAYFRAASAFDAALAEHDRLGRPSNAQRRRLVQWQRQASLAADLLPESLGEILRHSVGLPETEWEELVRRRYAGRSFILDDLLTRSAEGRHLHAYQLSAPGGVAVIELDHVPLVRELPLAAPQRVVLGLRIVDLRRGPLGWSIVPDPAGAVLITDPDLFAGLSLPADAELREVLKRQREWVER